MEGNEIRLIKPLIMTMSGGKSCFSDQLRRGLWLWCNDDSGAINVAAFGDLGGHTECLMVATGEEWQLIK